MKRKTGYKRIAVFLLTAALVFSAYTTAHAEENAANETEPASDIQAFGSTVEFSNTTDAAALSAAVANAQSGDTIKLTANVTSSGFEITDKAITLDLNGQTLSLTKQITLNGTASFKIVDSAGNGTVNLAGSSIYLKNASVFELESGNITASGTAIKAYGDGCTVKISGGNVATTSEGAAAIAMGTMSGTVGSSPGHFIMTDGSIQSNGFGVGITYGDLNISGGTIEAGIIALMHDGSPDTEDYSSSITGGTVRVTGDSGVIAIQLLYGDLTIGGNASIEGGQWTVANKSGTLTVKENASIVPNEDGIAVSNEWDTANSSEPGVLKIEGGAIEGSIGTFQNSSTTISGGVVSGDIYCCEGTNSTTVITGGTINGILSTDDNHNKEGKIVVRKGAFLNEVDAKYVDAGLVEASLTSSGDTLYYVGTGDDVAAVLADSASGGDAITVLQGTIDLSHVATEVNITNQGGTVIVDGATIEKDTSVVFHDTVKIDAKDATCTENGNTAYWYCADCGIYFDENGREIKPDDTVIPAAGHSYGADWKSDDKNHWHECTCGDKADITAHTFKWIIDQEATSTAVGSKHEECSVCGYKKAAVKIPAVGSSNTPTAKTESSGVPKTGDTGMTNGWMISLFLAFCGIVGITLYSGKHQKN